MAELLGTLGIDAFACPSCGGRMRLLALVRAEDEVRRFLCALGEARCPSGACAGARSAVLGESGRAAPERC